MKEQRIFALAGILSLFLFAAYLVPLLSESGIAGFFDNTSVESRVNVTNVPPSVSGVMLYQHDDGSTVSLTLAEGTTQLLVCNSTVEDYNGWADIAAVNATIYDTVSSNSLMADDNNYHYTNVSCTNTTLNITSLLFSCSFNVWYYANNASWNCNVSTRDIMESTATGIDATAPTIATLAALNLSTNLIDFGNMPPGNTTDNPHERTVNVTNTGNVNINLSLDGFGATPNDGMVMNCTLGNISVGNMRYNVTSLQNFDLSMATLTNSKIAAGIPGGYKVKQRIDDADATKYNSTNSTYWKLRIPAGTRGFCNGTVTFSAVV